MPDQNNSKKTLYIQIALFIITFITTTLAGAEWIYGRYFFLNEDGIGWNKWLTSDKIIESLKFSVPFLLILTVHEFGHYFTARYYKIKVTLPYYIPFWFGISSSIGTMGAFIQIKEQIKSRKEYFDVGLAGPMAGFLVALLVLFYGFTNLPPATYIFSIHPEYQQYGLDYAQTVYKGLEGNFYIGKNLIFWLFENYVADPSRIPNQYEIMHYPFLFAGFLACFFTALNLMPVGQLDGGHILYGLVGEKNHRMISLTLFFIFVFYAGLGTVSAVDFVNNSGIYPFFYFFFLYVLFSRIGKNFKTTFLLSFGMFTIQLGLTYFFPGIKGYSGWLLFAFILGRFLGVYHPVAEDNKPLDTKRIILGIVSLLIFVLCFTPTPFVVE
ncbi:MAG: site-2 protease family protein [Bacteroidota bacterium]|nr:site-2 protease family protein [Bacteroidota bacterium]